MRYHLLRKFPGVLYLFLGCFACLNAFAHEPRARECSAIIQSIDCQKQILTLTNVAEHVPLELIWHTDTLFVRG